MNATLAAAFVRNSLLVIWKREARTFAGTAYDAAQNALVDALRGEWVAGAQLGHIGQELDGTWSVLDAEGWVVEDGLSTRVGAKGAARRIFGPVIVG